MNICISYIISITILQFQNFSVLLNVFNMHMFKLNSSFDYIKAYAPFINIL